MHDRFDDRSDYRRSPSTSDTDRARDDRPRSEHPRSPARSELPRAVSDVRDTRAPERRDDTRAPERRDDTRAPERRDARPQERRDARPQERRGARPAGDRPRGEALRSEAPGGERRDSPRVEREPARRDAAPSVRRDDGGAPRDARRDDGAPRDARRGSDRDARPRNGQRDARPAADSRPREPRPQAARPQTQPALRPPAPTPVGSDASAFAGLGLSDALLRGLSDAGYERPTDIQHKAIPPALEGRDVLGAAQTGTGKTAAFVLPILQRMMEERDDARDGDPRALVIAPTRELALQIREGVDTYGRHTGLRCAVVYGGVNVNRHVDELARGTDILVATPGRLTDLMGQGAVRLDRIRYLVLDEVDRMLDQGFWPAIRRIVGAVPSKRQTLLFSATMPNELRPLADKLLVDPVHVSVAPVASTPDRIEQRVWHVPQQQDKRSLLTNLLRESGISRAIVFTKTKHGANRVAEQLVKNGINAAAIHGNKSQNARERALGGFREGAIPVLVATDLAARGIDVDNISHVINYDLPMDPESYVHRIGRTARAGSSGKAFSLCAAEERPLLSRIERLIGRRVPVEGRA